MPLHLHTLRGAAIEPHLEDLARLRISVFREWPYLYEGELDYERRYLEAFARAASSVLVVVEDEGRIVGASTALALSEETKALRQPFAEAGLAVERWYYLAESVLEPAYRGRGLGHRFFDAREAAGTELGLRRFTFCAVVRERSDTRRPAEHRDLDAFWRKRGYGPTRLTATLSWPELGAERTSEHALRFWVKGGAEHLSADER